MLPVEDEVLGLIGCVDAAEERGYYKPDEDEVIRSMYRRYLRVRVSMLDLVEGLRYLLDGEVDLTWVERLKAFTVGFSAGSILMRASRYLLAVSRERSSLLKKLDEAEPLFGIERHSFSKIYKSMSSPRQAWRYHEAIQFFDLHRDEIIGLAGCGEKWNQVVNLLLGEEPDMGMRKRDFVKQQFGYRLFEFKRRSASSYRRAMFHVFRLSGRKIADLKHPFVRKRGGKRVNDGLKAALKGLLKPGDVVITRHDDAMSNLFLPGFWPHAALYIGDEGERKALGLELGGEVDFIEAKKDGVLLRHHSETLHVDACVVLRPRLEPSAVLEALGRAVRHRGKRYDFLFDFRVPERLACTEVVYRGYHSVGGIDFKLIEKAGRFCLPAEDLLDQVVDNGWFEPVAICGVDGQELVTGGRVREILQSSYRTAPA